MKKILFYTLVVLVLSSYVCSITPTDGMDDGIAKNSTSLTIKNSPPTVPNLLTPADFSSFGAFPTFSWSTSTDADGDAVTYYIVFDDNNNFASPEYFVSTGTSTSHDPVDGEALPNNIIDQYYWKILATDSIVNTSSNVRTFNYSQWNIMFNITSAEFVGEELDNVNISSCTYVGFNQAGDMSNTYGPYAFPNGTWQCTFEVTTYYDKTKTFTADNDETVDVKMSVIGRLTDEEHTWLEAIYNCIIIKDCDLYNLLLQINNTVGNIWEHTKPTDTSVIASEIEISNTLNSTSNITYEYAISIPIKAGYNLGAYLPVRIGFWFMNETNESCYSQGTLPNGVTVIEPYCNPLMVQAIGPMGGSVSFRVDLRPNLSTGTYNVKRIIEIDPNEQWEGYGQEVIGTIAVTEDVVEEGVIDLDKTGESMPSGSSNPQTTSGSSGGSGGGSRGLGNPIGNPGVSNSPPIINQNTYITNVNNTYITDNSNEEEAESKSNSLDSGLGGITGAAIKVLKDLSNNGSVSIIIIALLTIIVSLLGYIYKYKRR